MRINMGLDNFELYDGCEIKEVGGKDTIITPIADATNIVGRNAIRITNDVTAVDRQEITLSGPMAVWAYLVVFHVVLHKFGKVYYDDGRSGTVLISQH